MARDERIDELLEAYRPGVDNLGDEAWQPLRAALVIDPEVKRRAEIIQRHDRTVHSAMHDVPVPVGLAERLLAALPQSEPTTEVLSPAPPVIEEPVSLPPHSGRPNRMRRRAWIAAVAGLAAVAVLAVTFWRIGPSDSGEVSQDELVQMVADWEDDPALMNSESWEPVAGSNGWSSHPLNASDLRGTASRAIGVVKRDGGLLLVVYDLTLTNGKSARLYVAHTGRTFGVSPTPGSFLRGLTGRRQAIAWQRDEHLYVVVVDEQEGPVNQFANVRDIT